MHFHCIANPTLLNRKLHSFQVGRLDPGYSENNFISAHGEHRYRIILHIFNFISFHIHIIAWRILKLRSSKINIFI